MVVKIKTRPGYNPVSIFLEHIALLREEIETIGKCFDVSYRKMITSRCSVSLFTGQSKWTDW
jgi:hypothetical protein